MGRVELNYEISLLSNDLQQYVFRFQINSEADENSTEIIGRKSQTYILICGYRFFLCMGAYGKQFYSNSQQMISNLNPRINLYFLFYNYIRLCDCTCFIYERYGQLKHLRQIKIRVFGQKKQCFESNVK